jgi:hypothetical protein
MRPHEIEQWVLNIVARVKANQPNEDSRVELKAEWPPDSYKTARQIAGHANAARGDQILWIVGVDQAAGIHEVDTTELATWYPTVRRHFDELAPELQDLNVPIDGKTVVALLFDT